MRKMITRLVWSEVYENIKENFLIEVVIVVVLVMDYMMSNGGLSGSAIILYTLLFWFVIIKMKRIPFRIYEGAYVCPMGQKEKLYYLSAKVGVKTIQKLLLFVFFFYGYENQFNIWDITMAEAILVVFTALYFSVGLEKSEQKEIKEKFTHSKEENTFRKDFLVIIIAEWSLYIIACMYGITFSVSRIIGILYLAFNVLFMMRNLKPYLLELLVYENIYNHKEIKEPIKFSKLKGGEMWKL